MFYASYNSRASLVSGNRGFLNTVEIARFPTRKDRDAFVAAYEDKMAEAVTRKQAIAAFADTYHCVGDEPPVGGLFGRRVDWLPLYEFNAEVAA